MPPGQPSIFAYYQAATESLRKEAFSRPEPEVRVIDREEWAKQLEVRWGMEPIARDPQRDEELEEIAGEPVAFVRYKFPVIPSDTIDVIMRHNLGASSWSPSYNPTAIKYDAHGAWLFIDCAGTTEAVDWAKRQLASQIGWWNDDILTHNRTFPGTVRQIIDERFKSLASKAQSLDDLAKQSGLKLRKRIDEAERVTVEVPIKKHIRPLLRQDKGQQRLVLSEESIKGILEIIDNHCRQLERNPTVYARMGEEDIRNNILATLNSVFGGEASGEAFLVLGKSDIRLPMEKGTSFVSECKWWGGEASLAEATQQLRERLTWHETHGAVILFSNRAEFSNVLKTVEGAIPKLAGSVGAVRRIADNHFGCQFSLASDDSARSEFRFLTYNLYLPRPSGRSKT